MIARLILRTQKTWQLILAIIGSLFGLTLLLFSTQVYLDINGIINSNKELINPQYLIINKQVSIFNTFTKVSPDFSEENIAELKKVKTVINIAGFKASTFSASAFINNDEHTSLPALSTDLFFESIPNEYLDVKPENWKWGKDDDIVPIIIPADYLNLYNFGFAPSQHLPQVSKGSIGMVTFNIRIKGKDTTAILKGQIAGFSNRINTILVPEQFMDYANKTFGDNETKRPSRLIVVSNDPTSTELSKYLSTKGYETNTESLKSGKLNSLLKMLLIIVTIVGIVIIFLSLLAFIQYSQLLIGNADYEIKTLIQLGVYFLSIARIIILFFTAIFTLILGGSLIAVYILKQKLLVFTQTYGFEISTNLSPTIYKYGFAIIGLLILINIGSIIISVRRLAK